MNPSLAGNRRGLWEYTRRSGAFEAIGFPPDRLACAGSRRMPDRPVQVNVLVTSPVKCES